MTPIITVKEGGRITILSTEPLLFTGNGFEVGEQWAFAHVGEVGGEPVYQIFRSATLERVGVRPRR